MRRELPQPRGGSGGGAREQRQRGARGDLGRRGDAAVGLHHQQRARERELGEAAREGVQIARDDRPDVGVEHRRRRAVVVADLRQQIARRRDVGAGHQLGDEVTGAPLVSGLGGRVHERDRDRLHALGGERLHRGAHVGRRERGELVALVVDPPADGQPQVARDERPGRREAVVVGLLARAVAQRERVAEALGREQAGARALAGQHGVRRDRRAVHDELEGGGEPLERQVELRGEIGEPGHDAARGIVGGAARLVHEAGALAHEQEVGERPADVDADPVAHAPPRDRSRAVARTSTERPSGASATP